MRQLLGLFVFLNCLDLHRMLMKTDFGGEIALNVRWNALPAWILILAILWVSYPCSCLADDEFESLKSDPCEAIRDGFYSFSERIDLSEYFLTVESLSFALSRALKDDPYLFYVDTGRSGGCDQAAIRDGCL